MQSKFITKCVELCKTLNKQPTSIGLACFKMAFK